MYDIKNLYILIFFNKKIELINNIIIIKNMSFCSFDESMNYLASRIKIILHKNLRNLYINANTNNKTIQISYHYMNKKTSCSLNITKQLTKDQIDDCINKLIYQIEERF